MAKSKSKPESKPAAKKAGKPKPKVSSPVAHKGKAKREAASTIDLTPPKPPSPEEQERLEAEWASLDPYRRTIKRLQHGMLIAGPKSSSRPLPADGLHRYYLCNLPPGCRFKLIDSPGGLVGAAGLLIKVGEGSCKVMWLTSREKGKTDSIARMTEVNVINMPDPETPVAPEIVLENMRAEQKQEKEAKKAAPKVKAPPPEKDQVGNRQGSQASQINTAMSTPKRQTLEAIAKATGLNKGRIMGHIKHLRSKGKLDENKAGTEFRLKK